MREGLDPQTLKAIYDRVGARYDLQHAILTARADQRGRRLLVGRTVRDGDHVLDCGAGTGSTSLLAARAVGPSGSVMALDASEGMLAVAKRRVTGAGLADRVTFRTGDILALPFADGTFDVVLSTYSMCPLYEPATGALELLRVARPGGRLGVAHSAEPPGRVARWLADLVEDVVWRIPTLTLGCRSVSVLPTLQDAGARVLSAEYIGVPLWPFFVFVVEKRA